MAGLEALFTCSRDSISCPHDAMVCFVHWAITKSGFQCVGYGDEPSSTDKKSDLLPPDWSSNKELYCLRYQARGGDQQLLLKAVTIDSALIFNLMNLSTHQLSDLTVDVNQHVNADQLHIFDNVYKDVSSLSTEVETQLLLIHSTPTGQRWECRSQREGRGRQKRNRADSYPPTNPSRHPHPSAPFAAGGADLDPLGSRGESGMIVDPRRSRQPSFGFDPSSGVPDNLPPGAVPPGARFDPFGPFGRHGLGPDPDHLPPPDYDDMQM